MTIKILEKQLESQFPLKILFLAEDDLHIRINQLELKERNKGHGTKIIEAIQAYAQKVGKPITLIAQPEPRKKEALLRFYRHQGFRKPGRTRDYRLQAGHTHIWKPK